MDTLAPLHARLRATFEAGKTRPQAWRRAQLAALAEMVAREETNILEALAADLAKPKAEAAIAEVDYIVKDARHALKKLARWMRPERVPTPLVAWPGASFIAREPYGAALIIGAWNYPIQELLSPLVGAIAAGNCAVLKPSELAPNASRLVAQMVPRWLDRDAFGVVEGGPETSQALLALRWDLIFFTGGTTIGRIVMAAAAQHLTPVVLELGGKSPTIVDETVDLTVAARRIAWGRYLNAGQLCIAPDYVLVAESRRDALVEALAAAIAQFYGPNPKASPDYARIVNDRHFERLSRLLGSGRVAVGGERDAQSRYIAPTVLVDVGPEEPAMQEEIFGPILPVLTYRSLEEAIAFINGRPTPLALHVFTADKATGARVLAQTRSGTALVNDVVIFQANPALPFGGVGESGMGAFHGRHSFEAFSHRKAVMKRGLHPDPAMRYPPFDAKKLALLRRLA